MVKTAILGGGLTGVTLARLLAERSHEVIVLEAESQPGGLCRSRLENGFVFDIGGSHIIFSRDREVLSFMKEMLGENAVERRRETKVLYRGRYVKYPFENGLHMLDQEDCFYCLHEYIRSLIAGEKGETPPPANFREWMYATFGAGITELYLLPYNEKIWKYPAEMMSCHWVEGRIPRPPVEDVIRSAIGIETEGYLHQLHFTYPRKGGIAALVEAIAAPVKDRIRHGFRVRSIRKEGARFRISDGRASVLADRCISTIPLHTLMGCLPDVPPEVAEACASLKYNSLYTVLVGFRGEVPPYSWVYTPEEGHGPFNRISFVSNYSPEAAPAGCSSILAEITFRKGDRIDSMPRDQVIRHVIESLLNLGLIRHRGEIVHTDAARQEFAYVIYDLDYQRNIRTVRDWVSGRGIDLVGRFAQFEYLNMDGCIRSAMDFVRGLS